MVIELLKIKVPPEIQQEYIQKDAEIWTAALAEYPGFVSKQVWLDPNNPTEVTLVIYWQTRSQWKAIPQEDLAVIEQRFTQQLGFTCEIVESSEYQLYQLQQ
jgi:uncharacterized protein (TIGR03792 family)